MTPDFEIKNLAEYKSEDLKILLRYVQSAKFQAKEWGKDNEADILDIWCYRIRDAKKQSEERV